MSVYIPWTLSAIRRKPKAAKIKSTFPADTRLIEVSNQLASRGAMLRWNPVTHVLEAVPYRTFPYRTTRQKTTYTNGGMEQIVNSSYWDEVDLPL